MTGLTRNCAGDGRSVFDEECSEPRCEREHAATARGCLPPSPLVTTAENAWYVTMIGYPAGHIGIRRGKILVN